MKNLILLFILCSLAYVIKAQEKVEVFMLDKEMSQGLQTAFVVVVPESDIDFVETRWKKYANERSFIENITKGAAGRFVENTYKSIANTISPETERKKNRRKLRVEKEHDEYIVRNIVHKYLTQDLLDIYARISQLDDGTQVSAFFRFTDSVFINESNVDEEMILSIKNYMYEFGVETYRGVVENQIKDAEKDLRKLNVVLSNLESKNESYEKSISRAESDIDNCESDIKLNNEQIKRVIELISDTRKEMLGQKKKSVAYEGYKDLLKEREKEKRKLANQNKSLKSKIKRLEARIKNTLTDILVNKKAQKLQRMEIEKQGAFIDILENKLSLIN